MYAYPQFTRDFHCTARVNVPKMQIRRVPIFAPITQSEPGNQKDHDGGVFHAS
jgi:hypothetical protein